MQNTGVQPRGEMSLRTVAMPADTNPAGDIFGGWIMSLMDLAAGIAAGTRAKGRVATAAVSNLSFLQPVKVGDVVCVYTEITKTGRTSITIGVEAYVLRHNQGERVRVEACRTELRATDTIGRFGGEEFAVLLPHTGAQAALAVAEKIRSAIARCKVDGANGVIRFTASFGVASLDGSEIDVDQMLKRADTALYAAKDAG